MFLDGFDDFELIQVRRNLANGGVNLHWSNDLAFRGSGLSVELRRTKTTNLLMTCFNQNAQSAVWTKFTKSIVSVASTPSRQVSPSDVNNNNNQGKLKARWLACFVTQLVDHCRSESQVARLVRVRVPTKQNFFLYASTQNHQIHQKTLWKINDNLSCRNTTFIRSPNKIHMP